MIKLSRQYLTRLFRLASFGKIIGGLIHNLNGPLQNLGLDIEMANHSLQDDSRVDSEMIKNIRGRLKRMEEEFERIDRLIKTYSIKASSEEDFDNRLINMNDYLKQELCFLETNLYFKHNVDKKIEVQDHPPPASHLPGESLTALNCFLQAFVEELEREKIKGLVLETLFTDQFFKILITPEGNNLSETFLEQLNLDASPENQPLQDDMNIGILLVMMIFKEEGISVRRERSPSGSAKIIITFPLIVNNS